MDGSLYHRVCFKESFKKIEEVVDAMIRQTLNG
jgi:hypothetical protein